MKDDLLFALIIWFETPPYQRTFRMTRELREQIKEWRESDSLGKQKE